MKLLHGDLQVTQRHSSACTLRNVSVDETRGVSPRRQSAKTSVDCPGNEIGKTAFRLQALMSDI